MNQPVLDNLKTLFPLECSAFSTVFFIHSFYIEYFSYFAFNSVKIFITFPPHRGYQYMFLGFYSDNFLDYGFLNCDTEKQPGQPVL
jgi:hypothetical protein